MWLSKTPAATILLVATERRRRKSIAEQPAEAEYRPKVAAEDEPEGHAEAGPTDGRQKELFRSREKARKHGYTLSNLPAALIGPARRFAIDAARLTIPSFHTMALKNR